MKVLREWTIDAPWGKIAMISWGNEAGLPVLLVHGRQDSAATFEPLLQLLPDSYHYVALDLPGHGRSDPFPTGVMPTRLHFVGAVHLHGAYEMQPRWHHSCAGKVEIIVRDVYTGRFVREEIASRVCSLCVDLAIECNDIEPNMCFFIKILHDKISNKFCYFPGLFFNAVYPHRISKMILLDPGPALSRLQVHDPQEYFASFHQKYYDNYDKFAQKRIYSKQRALEAVMKARGFTEAQARLALSRNMVKVGEDLYELSWDRRLICLPPPNYPPSYYYQLFYTPTPTLLIAAKEFQGGYTNGVKKTLKLISDLEKSLDSFTVVTVEGGHDVHFTNPERFIKVLCEFLDKKFECKSRL
ncbi:serine hydrolase-like protein 2 [Cydia splendana]|uniref:serine hydrolase-like protein 2 n=1 Tax=Cydia splendana TaxID=1100963 RepID=UPI00300C7C19